MPHRRPCHEPYTRTKLSPIMEEDVEPPHLAITNNGMALNVNARASMSLMHQRASSSSSSTYSSDEFESIPRRRDRLVRTISSAYRHIRNAFASLSRH